MFIPPRVTKICEDSFYPCKSLKVIEIDEKNDMKTIEQRKFCDCENAIVLVPMRFKDKFI